jgi:hypothetical protein
MRITDAVVLLAAIAAVTTLIVLRDLTPWALAGPFLLVSWRFGVRL